MVFLVLAKAFLQNNEPKAAQVCLKDASANWIGAREQMTSAQIADCQQDFQLLEAKVVLERQNTTFVGDLKEFAFIKEAPKTSQTEAPKEVPKSASSAKPSIVSKYDWY